MSNEQLRVVTFNFNPGAYQLVTRWIAENNHKHVLAVTTPGPTTRPTPSYREIIDLAPRNVDVLVTTRLRRVATPLIKELEPDLILCFSFPYRLTSEIMAIPKRGAVNLHPGCLPEYRGPNVFRMLYDEHDLGVSVHWMDEDFDTGRILSQKRISIPEIIDPESLMSSWWGVAYQTLNEGMEKALAGDPGMIQDDGNIGYAAPFTEGEHWLDWDDTQRGIQLKHMALTFADGAKARIGNGEYLVTSMEVVDSDSSGEAGTVLSQDGDGFTIQVKDGAVRVGTSALEE